MNEHKEQFNKSVTEETLQETAKRLAPKQFPELVLEFDKLVGRTMFPLRSSLSVDYQEKIRVRKAVALCDSLINEKVNSHLRRNLLQLIINPLVGSKVELKELAMISKDIADSIYVLCTLANTLGIPLTRIFNATHYANLDTAADGLVHRRADGETIKPKGWQPADIEGILQETLDDK